MSDKNHAEGSFENTTNHLSSHLFEDDNEQAKRSSRRTLSVKPATSMRSSRNIGWLVILASLFLLLPNNNNDTNKASNGRSGNSRILLHDNAQEKIIAKHDKIKEINNKNGKGEHIPTRKLHHHHKHNKKQLLEPIDYSLHSCDEMNDLQFKYPDRIIDRCDFAKNCNGGDGVLFPSLFCGGSTATSSASITTTAATASDKNVNGDSSSQDWIAKMPNTLLLILLSLSLLLLFHLLNSTTDEFFSPGLELFSLNLGLPPRFAAVTLLALGNGAPDVAATINAILEDPSKGYQMAVGELTGTAMFVSGVILGVIVFMSGDDCDVTDNDVSGSVDGDMDSDVDVESVIGGETGANGTGKWKCVDQKKVTDSKDDFQEGNSTASNNDDDTKPRPIKGVPCRGALLRDIAVLILVLIVTMFYFERGVVDCGLVYSLLGIYISYVLLVLGADSYHLLYHLPQLLKDVSGKGKEDEVAECFECGGLKRKSDKADDSGEVVGSPSVANENTPLMLTSTRSDNTQVRQQAFHNHSHNHHHCHQSLPAHSHTLGDSVIEAMSNYDCDEERFHDHCHNHHRHHSLGRHQSRNTQTKNDLPGSKPNAVIKSSSSLTPRASISASTKTAKGTGWAPPSDDGTEPIVIFHPHHAVHPHHNGGRSFIRRESSLESSSRRGSESRVVQNCRSWSHGDSSNISENENEDGGNDIPSVTAIQPPLASNVGAGTATTTLYSTQMINNTYITNAQNSEGVTTISIEGEDIVKSTPSNWAEALIINYREWADHWKDLFKDIYQNKDNSAFDVIVLTVELPFTIARKLTNPVPCDGYYCRPLVAISIALSPIWIRFYSMEQFDEDIFSSYVGYVATVLTSLISLCVLRYAPNGEGPMDFYMVVPITLYGFAIAATWLDSIADKLVQLLELFGILLRIPKTVMGLTVLAFGNSLQDLIANISISKKGLSTMAVTACLAGPIFNFGVGLGLGFWALMKATDRDEIPVVFPSDLKTGFYFTIANCLLIVFAGTVIGKGVIGKEFGYVACALYVVYVFTSLYVV